MRAIGRAILVLLLIFTLVELASAVKRPSQKRKRPDTPERPESQDEGDYNLPTGPVVEDIDELVSDSEVERSEGHVRFVNANASTSSDPKPPPIPNTPESLGRLAFSLSEAPGNTDLYSRLSTAKERKATALDNELERTWHSWYIFNSEDRRKRFFDMLQQLRQLLHDLSASTGATFLTFVGRPEKNPADPAYLGEMIASRSILRHEELYAAANAMWETWAEEIARVRREEYEQYSEEASAAREHYRRAEAEYRQSVDRTQQAKRTLQQIKKEDDTASSQRAKKQKLTSPPPPRAPISPRVRAPSQQPQRGTRSVLQLPVGQHFPGQQQSRRLRSRRRAQDNVETDDIDSDTPLTSRSTRKEKGKGKGKGRSDGLDADEHKDADADTEDGESRRDSKTKGYQVSKTRAGQRGPRTVVSDTDELDAFAVDSDDEAAHMSKAVTASKKSKSKEDKAREAEARGQSSNTRVEDLQIGGSAAASSSARHHASGPLTPLHRGHPSSSAQGSHHQRASSSVPSPGRRAVQVYVDPLHRSNHARPGPSGSGLQSVARQNSPSDSRERPPGARDAFYARMDDNPGSGVRDTMRRLLPGPSNPPTAHSLPEPLTGDAPSPEYPPSGTGASGSRTGDNSAKSKTSHQPSPAHDAVTDAPSELESEQAALDVGGVDDDDETTLPEDVVTFLQAAHVNPSRYIQVELLWYDHTGSAAILAALTAINDDLGLSAKSLLRLCRLLVINVPPRRAI